MPVARTWTYARGLVAIVLLSVLRSGEIYRWRERFLRATKNNIYDVSCMMQANFTHVEILRYIEDVWLYHLSP